MICTLLALGALQTWAAAPVGASQGTSQTALPPDTAYAVVERGANHRVWEKTSYEPGINGVAVPKKHRYTELATGMHYQQNGQWVESKEVIEPYATGAVARQGQYHVIFANNLNSYAAIDQQTPDGKRIRSNILGLEYYDTATGKNALIAEVQDSSGQLVAANQVLYHNAFHGFTADVLYTYKRGSFEQDVILREQPPTPESYGLNPATTVLEVLTEFVNPPQAQTLVHRSKNEADTDTDISWGRMGIGRGKAFDLSDKHKAHSRTPVTKEYFKAQGRQFLLEEVPLASVQSSLSSLPQQSRRKSIMPATASVARVIPAPLLAQASTQPMKLASIAPSNQGYVLDYVEMNIDQGDTVFQSDTTYLITGNIYVSGNTVFEGGAVIKYNDDDSNPSITEFSGSIICKTGPYRPAVFTSRNDDTVGESLNDGGPLAYFQALAEGGADGDQLRYIRVSYANTGVHTYNINLSDSQFINCQYPIEDEWGTCNMTNVLMVNVGTAFYGTAYNVNAYHLTVDGCTDGQFCEDWDGPTTNNNVLCVNSLLVNVGTDGDATITTDHTARVTGSSSDYFQTAGAGAHYLATNSPYMGAGTTNIDQGILMDLATKTTWPPLIYSNLTITVPTTFSPQVPRDTNAAPDLGYHYDPLDYAFGGVDAYSNLTFTAGTAAGWFELPGSGGPGYGISLYDHVVASFNGLVTEPCVVARYSSVQEGGDGLWTDQGWLAGIAGQSLSGGYSMDPTNAPQAIANFTDFAALAHSPNHFRELNALLKVTANNCEFWSSSLGGYWEYYYFTNNLFDRVYLGIVGGNDALMTLRNCTMRGGSVSLYWGETWPIRIENCSFDGTDLSGIEDSSGGDTNILYCDHNAIVTNLTTLPATGGHDVVVTTFNWQSSWFGDYYLPTNSPLINVGSTTADQVGLYHFTTQTTQVPETNSIVDIGYHYVATDAYGYPLDTNGDGIPDYLEDANGNGLFDAGDIADWLAPIYGDGYMAFTNGISLFIFESRPHSQIP